ncbi:site-2 protease family protein [Myxococcota bacterium]|nr:site-2 protease family protein [Myxococcota bacterium]
MWKFLVFLGVLITFHEMGHFLVARLLGVTVLRFSVGFGPKLLGFRRGITEYWISAIPLGGYVKFLGDDPDHPPEGVDPKTTFLFTDLWRRVLIVLAGPFFNLALPFLLLFPPNALEREVVPAVLGSLAVGEPAWEAGLRPGDRILEVDGRPVEAWWELVAEVSRSPGRPLRFRIEREGRTMELPVTPKAVQLGGLREIGWVPSVGRIEASPNRTPPVVTVAPGGPAARAGIGDFDALLAADGKPLWGPADLERALDEARHRPVTFEAAPTREDQAAPGPSRQVLLGPLGDEDPGIADASLVATRVDPDSPASQAGLEAGDRILALDGRPVSDWAFLVQGIARDPGVPHAIEVLRGTERRTLTLDLRNPDWKPGSANPRWRAPGIQVRRAVLEAPLIPNQAPFRYAWYQTTTRTREILAVTAAGLFGLFTGKVSLKEMGGPLMIYDIAATARAVEDFLDRMAWLSMSLALLNLLPIPVLDGGHLLMFTIEAVRRRPVGPRGRQVANWIGLAFLLGLMVLVFVNDIERKWGLFSRLAGG